MVALDKMTGKTDLDEQGAERRGRLRLAGRGRRAGRADGHDVDRRGRRRRARVRRQADVAVPAGRQRHRQHHHAGVLRQQGVLHLGYGTGGALLGLRADGGEVQAQEIYFTRDMQNHHGGVVLVNGYLYGFNNSILTCLEFATGKMMWRDRSVGKGVAHLRRRPPLYPERKQRRRPRRGDARRLSGEGPVRDRRPGLAELGASGGQRRPACISAIRARWPATTSARAELGAGSSWVSSISRAR